MSRETDHANTLKYLAELAETHDFVGCESERTLIDISYGCVKRSEPSDEIIVTLYTRKRVAAATPARADAAV